MVSPELTEQAIQILQRLFPGYNQAMLHQLAVEVMAETQDAAALAQFNAVTLPADLVGATVNSEQLLVMFAAVTQTQAGGLPLIPTAQQTVTPGRVPGTYVGSGRYRIEQLLGSGAFGDTYLATDCTVPGAFPCVVKQLRVAPDTPTAAAIIATLHHEANLLAALGGGSLEANLPDLYAIYPEEFCLVMTAVQGQSVDSMLAEYLNGFPVATVLGMLEDISAALAYLHVRQIIHHDLKPANLICDAEQRIWLADFGIGRTLTQLLSSSAIFIGGTPFFMPPEQLAGLSEERSDIYALGMTALVLLTGQSAYLGPQRLLAVLAEQRPHVPVALQRLISRCLSPEVGLRPRSEHVLHEIQRLRRQRYAPPVVRVPSRIAELLAIGDYQAISDLIEQKGRRFSTAQWVAISEELEAVRAKGEQAPITTAMILNCLASLAWMRHQVAEAEAYIHAGLDILAAAPAAPVLRARLLIRLGTVYGIQERYDEATILLQEAQVLAHQAGAWRDEARAWHNLAHCADALQHMSLARDCYQRSLVLREQYGDLEGAIENLINLGLLMWADRRPELARAYFQRCRDVSKQLGRFDTFGQALTNLGTLQCDLGEHDLARENLTLGARLCLDTAQPSFRMICLYNLGELALKAGDVAGAQSYAHEVLQIAREQQLGSVYVARARRILGKVAMIQGNLAVAQDQIQRAWRLRGAEAYDWAFLLAAKAELAFYQRRRTSATRSCQQALALAETHVLPALATDLRQLATLIHALP